jgi:phage tail sheath gpL-like
MIGFEYFPAYRRASMVAIEMAGKKRSLAGAFIPELILIVGQYDQTKTAIVENVPFKCYTAEEVGQKCGFGSELYRQALWIFARLGGFSENVWIAAVPLPTGTPVAASGTVVFAGTATSAGTLYFSIGGDLLALSVAKGTAAAAVATAFNAAVNAAIGLAVGSAVESATATLTAKWAGATGNEIRIVLNPDGPAEEAANPSGITVTLPTNGLLASGAGDPDVEDVFFDAAGGDALKDRWYTIIQMPYVDSTALGHLKASGDLRFDPATKRFFASYIGYVNKTYAQAAAVPATLNSRWLCPVWENRSLSPAFELGAATAGAVAASALVDPGRPFKTLPLGIPVDADVVNRTYAENDALFRAGIGYCWIDASGALRIGDLASSYRTAASGAATEEWFDAVSIHRRQQKVYSLDQLFSGEPYSRGILGSDDMVTGKSYVIKPKTVITDLMNLVDVWASEGWTKNPDAVKASIASEINAGNNSRIDATLTDDEAQALRIVALKYAFLY